MQPTIGLTYRSDGAIYGGVAAGWSLDVPAIQLDTSDGILDPERKWVSSLSGGEALVRTDEPRAPGVVGVYRAKYDLGGLRYERYAPDYPYAWVVRAPSGAVFKLGKRAGNRPTRTLSLLSRAEDAHGNAVEYDWSWHEVRLASRLGALAYQLDAIHYTSNDAAGLPAFAHVAFSYESGRMCGASRLPVGSQLSARSGTPIVHGYGRLRTISTSTVDRTANGKQVRVHTLIYDEDEASCDLDGAPRRQLLGIKTTGYAPDGTSIDAPPVTFDYYPRRKQAYYRQDWDIGDRENGHLHSRTGLFVDQMLVDMDGDGLPDRLTSTDQRSCDFYWQRNTGFGFEEDRRHVQRPRLAYGESLGEHWVPGMGPPGIAMKQRCALNLQYTLVISDSLPSPNKRCSSDDYNHRVGSMVNWRFLDADRDGLVDMVAGVDVNKLSLDPSNPGFADPGLLSTTYDRYSQGTFYADIEGLIQASRDLYDGPVEWDCENTVPLTSNKSYPWIVFRNVGDGEFAPPETWAMPVPVVASSSTSRKKLGEDQVGPVYDEVTLPGGSASLLADPFSTVDIDGDGLLDIVSSFKSATELDGTAPPSTTWKVLRGAPNGLYRSLPGDEPYQFRSPVHAHANGTYVDGGMNFYGTDEEVSKSFAASASGLYDLNGDGAPDFVWVESDSYDIDNYDNWNTSAYGWLGTGEGVLDCESSPECALTFMPSTVVGDGGITNLSSRVSTATTDYLDFDGDGEYEDSVTAGTMLTPGQLIDVDGDDRLDLVNRGKVRFGVGDGFLGERDLDEPMRWAISQREFTYFDVAPGAFATTLLLDVDGDGRMDPMIHQTHRLDPDGDGVIDGLDLEVTDEPGTWSAYLAAREPVGKLRRISNGIGGETHIDYASVRDEWIVEDWHLPLQAWVVSSVTTNGGDATPAQVTTYRYRDAAWVADEDGRFGFRGFRHVTTQSPTGASTESTFSYDKFYKGIPSQTVVSDASLTGKPPRTVQRLAHERVVVNSIPLFVVRLRDHWTCGASGTVEDCVAGGAHLRTSTEWRTLESGGAPQLYVPWRETTVDSSNSRAIIVESEYQTRISETSYRVKVGAVSRWVRDGEGLTLIGRATTVYDDDLRLLLESHEQVDSGRVAVTRFTYDPQTGLMLTSEAPESVATGANQRTTTVYDAHRASVSQVVNPAGHVVRTMRDLGTGQTQRTEGPQFKCPGWFLPCVDPYRKWRTTSQRFDGLGRLVSVSRSFDSGTRDYALLEVERHSYHEWNGSEPAENKVVTERRIDATEPANWTRGETVMDGLGRTVSEVVRTFDPAVPDAVTILHRDRRGLVTAVETPDPAAADTSRSTMHYDFDGLGRLTRAWHASGVGGERLVHYDGLVMETELAPGDEGPAARVRVTNNVLGQMVRVEELMSDLTWATTDYAYDGNENLETVVDADGIVTRLGHDFAGNRIWIQRGGRQWNYQYDLEGRVTHSTVPHPAGQAQAYTSSVHYDALGRIVARFPAPGDLTPLEQAELAFGPVTYVYDDRNESLGAASRVSTPAGVDEFRYDPSGNVTWTTQRFTAPAAPADLRTATATYNALGAIVSTVVNGSLKTS